MGGLDRLRRRIHVAAQRGASGTSRDGPGMDDEGLLRERLSQDPNDIEAFARLAEVVRRRAIEGHGADSVAELDRNRAADDAVWALAEELAWSGRAWYPLVELARLSIEEDREAALKRLGTASERDPSGRALASGLHMLREAGHPADALSLGLGHWRPAEHDVEAGRELVEAAVEADRLADARRHLDALLAHPDQARVEELRPELERLVAGGARPRVVDVRSERGSRLRSFLRL